MKKLLPLLGTIIGFWATVRILHPALRLMPEPIGSHADLFAEGAQTTLQLTLISGTIGFFIGIALALGKQSPSKILTGISDFILWLVRGTPLLVQILFTYFALPVLIPQLQMNEFAAAALALSINVGAYNSEIFRAGIQAVHKGQKEAARSLGMSATLTFTHIIFPQALRISLPPLVNNLVALLKDSSLASSIGLLELALAGSRISSETFQPVPVLTTIAVTYLLLTTVLTFFSNILEKTLNQDSVKSKG